MLSEATEGELAFPNVLQLRGDQRPRNDLFVLNLHLCQLGFHALKDTYM